MNGTLLLMTARSPTAGRNTAALTLSKKTIYHNSFYDYSRFYSAWI
ncbi:hypothetical protein ETAE_1351 [Edwardsiella piscicida]|uniref:Uncharacterized protein n=1 Tax=Edwardsiella piscicida TaxID=1263550 RepID=A0AAU8PG37_EDWPI|nr:hypothetical protein ETAE_1351 [Edwardsiella tarda EIB202]